MLLKLFLSYFLFFGISLKPLNDGAFFASGNHLIPIVESEISVKKEILTIKRVKEDFVQVTVDYQFFNPASEKTILVGFEAPPPSGGVDGTPKNTAHPYISGFKVYINSEKIPFKTAIVKDKNYFVDNAIQTSSIEEVVNGDFNPDSPDFYYVYYFNATFLQGISNIKHTYTFKLSNSIATSYSFDYQLTAANRWANRQIDDFTLTIDLGRYQDFFISKSFFREKNSWKIDGKIIEDHSFSSHLYLEEDVSRFYVNKGPITFKKKNFTPAGELFLYSLLAYIETPDREFNFKAHKLPFSILNSFHIKKSIDEQSFKILRNLPFARRGYVFKTQLIQDYYLSQDWYQPDGNVMVKVEDLSFDERIWLEEVLENKW